MATTSDPNSAPIEHILLCGGGLAGYMTAAALSHQLPPGIRITLVDTMDTAPTDIFYGNVTSPSAYDFNLQSAVTETQLVLNSNTAFSYGTRYQGWGVASWTQCYHLPFPVLGGVQFHHYLTRLGQDSLEPYLVSAIAANHGAFAHPPQQQDQPLSRAEYGYQIDPLAYAVLFGTAADKSRIQRIAAAVEDVDLSDAGIAGLRLAGGRTVAADLYIDCTGPRAALLSRLEAAFAGRRQLHAAAGVIPAARLGPAYRTVTPGPYGWQSETPLKGGTARLTVYDPDSEAEALAAHGAEPAIAGKAALGRHDRAWCGNCVALGHAAAVVEPLTPAPIMLLQRDIERLLSLIPFSREMSVERREFNRQYSEDYSHAGLFNRALFETGGLPGTPYWQAARNEPVEEKLARKIEQFKSRGLLVPYDLEPFNAEDWTILHYGTGWHPDRHDRMADQAEAEKVRQYLAGLQNDIENMVRTMPDHDSYMTGLTRFLMQKRG